MLDTLRKLFLFGIGAIELTGENLRSAFEDLVKRGELTEKEARELAADWLKRASEQRANLQRQIEEAIGRQLERLAMAKQRDLEALAGRVTALEAKIEELQGQTTRN
jgi:poly(hydroxyalkanoate) granule-associated protein